MLLSSTVHSRNYRGAVSATFLLELRTWFRASGPSSATANC